MLTVENTTVWLNKFADQIEQHQSYLSELDTPIGDGDHRGNMARGLAAVKAALATQPADITKLFQATAMALISKVGGASGPLYGTAFLEMAKQSKIDSDLGGLLAAALAGIEKRGGATTGDKTLIDVWAPVVQAVQAGELTQDVIDDAVASTEPMVAKKGEHPI